MNYINRYVDRYDVCSKGGGSYASKVPGVSIWENEQARRITQPGTR